jgi:hypothetical protein
MSGLNVTLAGVVALLAVVLVAWCVRHGNSRGVDRAAVNALIDRVDGKRTPREQAEELLERIRPGMDLREILRVLHQEAWVPGWGLAEHGGTWFDIPVSCEFIVQVRLSHPANPGSFMSGKINYSPRLRDRQTLKFLAGAEQQW